LALAARTGPSESHRAPRIDGQSRMHSASIVINSTGDVKEKAVSKHLTGS
jgi:hypothetical protein